MRVYALPFFAMLLTLTICEAVASQSQGQYQIELGRKLFFEPRLSRNGSISCANCHKPELAFTNGQSVAIGIDGKPGERNVPTLINRAGTKGQFWEMTVNSLEAQARFVIQHPKEMAGDEASIVRFLQLDPEYRNLFSKAFSATPNMARVAQAIVAFESTLTSGESPYDRYQKGDDSALSALEQHGRDLFFNKYKCSTCHSGSNFSDEQLNVRCYPFTDNLKAIPGPRFKTPTLRNLNYTAPYMHNGSLQTLEDAVEFYNPSVNIGSDGKTPANKNAIRINAREKKALVAFLKSLSAETPYSEKH